MAMSDPAKELLDRFYTAWLRRDHDAVLDCLTDDVVYTASTGPEPGQTYHGKTVVGQVLADQLEDDGSTMVRDEPIVLGDHAFGTWSVHWPGFATPIRGVDLYTLRGGLIAAKDVYRKISTE